MATAGTFFRSLLNAARKIAVVVIFVGMVTLGYLSMSAATSCPADAQVCTCGTCVLAGPTSVSALFAVVASQTASQIATATGLITTQYELAATAFAEQATIEFGQIMLDFNDWFDTFWYYNEKPALQAQTEQANVLDSIEAVTMSMLRDGANLMHTDHLLAELDLQSQEELQPSTGLCIAATGAGGLARAYKLSEAYANAAAAEASPRSALARGTPAAAGTLADIRARAQDVQQKYCAAGENNAGPDCRASGDLVNADIDVAGTVFSKETIDLTDPNVKGAVDALVTNIAEPFVANPIAKDALTTTGGIEASLARDAARAQRQTIHAALQYMIALRAPSGASSDFIAAMREGAGIAPDMISDNPSAYEMTETILNNRYRTGQYSTEQVDTATNAERELTVQNAFQVIQMDRNLELLSRYALMLAAQTGAEARDLRDYDSVSGARPQK